MKKAHEIFWAIVDCLDGSIMANDDEGYVRVSRSKGCLVPGTGQRFARVEIREVWPKTKPKKARKETHQP